MPRKFAPRSPELNQKMIESRRRLREERAKTGELSPYAQAKLKQGKTKKRQSTQLAVTPTPKWNGKSIKTGSISLDAIGPKPEKARRTYNKPKPEQNLDTLASLILTVWRSM